MAEEQVKETETTEATEEAELPLEQAIEESKAEDAPPSPDPAMETRATDMGWVPQEQWRGNPDAWRPAAEYVRRGEEVLPIVQSTNRRLKDEVARYKDEMSSLKDRMDGMRGEFEETLSQRTKRLEGMTKAALESQREQIWRQYEIEKDKAFDDSNKEEYQRLKTEQNKAMSDFKPEADYEEEATPPPKAEPAKQLPQLSTSDKHELDDWMGQNNWFNRDPELTALASAHHGRLLQDMPGISLQENLSLTTSYVREKFPEKFGLKPNGAQRHAPSVEGGGRQVQATSKAQGWNDLPREAKVAAATFFDDGLFGADVSVEKAQKTYAKKYWEQF